MSEFPPNRWFALQVRSKSEKMVAFLLRSKGYEDFLPLYQPSSYSRSRSNTSRELPLFPGYVFCRSTPSASGLIVTTPGVVRILGVGTKPQPVEDQEIATLKAVLRSGLPFQPWPKLEPGDPLVITNGPLRGCSGVLKSWKNRTQLLLSVEILQRSVAVTVSADELSVAPVQLMREIEPRIHPRSEIRLKQVG